MSNNILQDISPSSGNISNKSFWQSPLWAEILTGTHQAKILSYTAGNISLLIERREIWKQYTGLYVLGPNANALSENVLDDICKKIASPSDLFLQIEPLTGAYHQVGRAPFRRFLESKTAVIPLTEMTEETLINRFEEKGRYNIRVAQRRGLTAHWVQGDTVSSYALPGKNQSGATNIELFFSLLEETTERDNFSHNSLVYYKHFVSVLEKNDAGGLLFVIKDNTLHAAGIFVYSGNQGIYYYGASSNSQEIRRDHGTYLLQWEAIREALHRGCTEYDFLGISSRPGDKLAGVTTFKMRFSPEKVTLPQEKVIIFKPVTLRILQLMSRLRKLF